MTLKENEILEIMKAFDESHFDELQLEVEGLKMALGKGAVSGDRSERIASHTEGETGVLPPRGDSPALAPPPAGPSHEEARAGVGPARAGLLPVQAPLMGIFYRSPKPGAPPFVSVGSHVDEDTTVCIIEVMKLFTGVKAGVKGRVAEICVENSRLVEYQETLFLIDPSGDQKDPEA